MGRIINKIKSVRVVSVALIIFMVFVVLACGKQAVRIMNLSEQRAALEVTYQEELDRGTQLAEQRELLNDPTYMERLARKNLLMIRDGEYLVVPAEENDDVVNFDNTTPNDVH